MCNVLKKEQSDIIIRKALPEDLPYVYTLICKLENDVFNNKDFEQIFLENLKNINCFYYVAEFNNKIVGFISLHIQNLLHHCGKVGELQEFYIEEKYRNKGIGKSLVVEIKKIAEINNVKSLEVTSNKSRTENVNIYEKLGFKLTHNKLTL